MIITIVITINIPAQNKVENNKSTEKTERKSTDCLQLLFLLFPKDSSPLACREPTVHELIKHQMFLTFLPSVYFRYCVVFFFSYWTNISISNADHTVKQQRIEAKK